MKKLLILAVLLGGCAQVSPPMENADGSYLISGRAAPVRGGATGAYEVAFKDAQKFCAQGNRRAVIQNAEDRDIYQTAVGGGWSGGTGGFSGNTLAAGSATLRFRCV